MAYSPKLQKQLSCCCPPFDLSGRRRPGRYARRFDNNDDDEFYDEEFDATNYQQSNIESSRWRGIWRRIVREKRRIFDSGAQPHGPYDAYSYAQNFDDGTAWVEPENLSRSFSARFAVPLAISNSS